MNASLFPKVSHSFFELDGTNAEALRRITAGEVPAHGSVIAARAQVQGRGQGSNAWHASPGRNLTLSLVLQPRHLPPARIFALSQLSSLAVARTLAALLPDERAARVRVKWPNDVYVGDQKVAGVLVQNGLRGNRLHWSVVGIGLNVNETDFPPALAASATSPRLLTGREYDLTAVRATLFHHLSELYPYTLPAALPDLDRLYHQLLYRKNEPSLFQPTDGGAAFRATIRGVDQHGRLRLTTPDGERTTWALREIRLL